MDVSEFDKKYPSPAHAAAFELEKRYITRSPRSFLRLRFDRSGAVTVGTALIAAAAGTYLLLAELNQRIVRPGSITAYAPRQVLAYSPTSKRKDYSHNSRMAPGSGVIVPQPLARANEANRRRSANVKRITPPVSKSRWIADPLSGEELRAALIVDKRKTVELNAEQLRLMAQAREQRLFMANTNDVVPNR